MSGEMTRYGTSLNIGLNDSCFFCFFFNIEEALVMVLLHPEKDNTGYALLRDKL